MSSSARCITSLVGDNERTLQTKQVLACFESKTEAMLKLCIACSSKVNEISLFKAKGKIEMFLRFSLQRDFEGTTHGFYITASVRSVLVTNVTK